MIILYQRRSKGFTLIELLVVLGIISILAAILFPAYATAREKARQITCASNEKQMGLGLTQYLQDNDLVYPGFVGFSSNNNNGFQVNGLWGNVIFPYVKSLAVYKCPDIPANSLANYTYMMNALLGAGVLKGKYLYGNAQGANYGVQDNQVSYPDRTICLIEGTSGYDSGCVANRGTPPNCQVQVVLGSYMVYQVTSTTGPGEPTMGFSGAQEIQELERARGHRDIMAMVSTIGMTDIRWE